MSSVVVTGGTGFVGANLVRALLDQQVYDVHLLVRKESQYWRLQSVLDRLHLHEVDMCDLVALTDLFATIRPKAVFHLATYGAYPYRLGHPYQQDVDKMLDTNVIATVQLTRAAIVSRTETFISVGSSSEYGPKDYPMFENDLCMPLDTYGATKLSGAYIASTLARQAELPFHHMRLFSVYGDFEENGRLVPTVLKAFTRNEVLRLASPFSVRDFIYVDDAVKALLHPVEAKIPSGIYNVGTGIQSSVQDVVSALASIAPQACPLEYGAVPPRPGEPKTWVADITKIGSTGWSPMYDLARGLHRSYRWFGQNVNFYL